MPTSRLLVVEDNRDIANVLSLYLTGQGYQVKVVDRRPEVVARLRQEIEGEVISSIRGRRM